MVTYSGDRFHAGEAGDVKRGAVKVWQLAVFRWGYWCQRVPNTFGTSLSTAPAAACTACWNSHVSSQCAPICSIKSCYRVYCLLYDASFCLTRCIMSQCVSPYAACASLYFLLQCSLWVLLNSVCPYSVLLQYVHIPPRAVPIAEYNIYVEHSVNALPNVLIWSMHQRTFIKFSSVQLAAIAILSTTSIQSIPYALKFSANIDTAMLPLRLNT